MFTNLHLKCHLNKNSDRLATTSAFPCVLRRRGVTRKIRRSSVSIESTLVSRFMSVKPPTALTRNLAEGCGRDGDKEFARFVDISMGSSLRSGIL